LVTPFPRPHAAAAAPQDEIHRRYRHGSALHMMCWMNFWCGLYYVPPLFLLTGMGRELLAFCTQHPEVGNGTSRCAAVPLPLRDAGTGAARCPGRGWRRWIRMLHVHTFPTPLTHLLHEYRSHLLIHASITSHTRPAPSTQAATYVLLFCLCGAVGQLFIFATIKRFGSLLNTLVTTTRKFFNILLSGGSAVGQTPPAGLLTSLPRGAQARQRLAGGHGRLLIPSSPPPLLPPLPAVLWNANPLLPQQWVAVALVFSGLLISSWTKSRRHARPAPQKQA
jgi:hypothetical protein